MTTSIRIAPLLLAVLAGSHGYTAPSTSSAPSAPTGPSTPSSPSAAPAPGIAGTWQGKLQVDPNTNITIQFAFTRKADGTWTATLNSPDNSAIKNVAANSVAWAGGKVTVQVASLSGSYTGTWKDGNIVGQWTQPGSSLPLALTPYEKPQMSKADIDLLLGNWHGPLKTPAGVLTFVFRFSLDDKSALQGIFSVPEQGANIPMTGIELTGGKLDFKIPQAQGEFDGTYANNAINGTWTQGGVSKLPVTLTKGDFAAPVWVLDKLSSQAFAALNGEWQGALQITSPQGQKVTLPLVLHFRTNAQAQIIGFMDSPSQHATGIPVTDATLTAGALVIKVASIGAEYHANLSGNALTGKWTQGPLNTPLTLTRK